MAFVGGSRAFDPATILNAQRQQQEAAQKAEAARAAGGAGAGAAAAAGGPAGAGAGPIDYQQAYKDEQGKALYTKILTNLANLNSGRQTVPQRNLYQDQGREGLVDPSLTGQATRLPLPFDERYASTANLRAIITSLPEQTYQVSEGIAKQVATQIPQIQRQLKMQSTIYQQYPPDFAANRLNISMQHRRLTSIYAVV